MLSSSLCVPHSAKRDLLSLICGVPPMKYFIHMHQIRWYCRRVCMDTRTNTSLWQIGLRLIFELKYVRDKQPLQFRNYRLTDIYRRTVSGMMLEMGKAYPFMISILNECIKDGCSRTARQWDSHIHTLHLIHRKQLLKSIKKCMAPVRFYVRDYYKNIMRSLRIFVNKFPDLREYICHFPGQKKRYFKKAKCPLFPYMVDKIMPDEWRHNPPSFALYRTLWLLLTEAQNWYYFCKDRNTNWQLPCAYCGLSWTHPSVHILYICPGTTVAPPSRTVDHQFIKASDETFVISYHIMWKHQIIP